jgi:hypothetical protein
MHILKSFTIMLLVAVSPTSFFAQNVTIPDPIFKDRLLNHDPDVDTNDDGEIQISEALDFTTTLQLSGSSSNEFNIMDLTGIEAFINVSTINAGRNDLTSIDVTQNIELRNLRLDDNMLSEIDVSQNTQLRGLVLFDNPNITVLDLTNNPDLQTLQASEMNLGTLDLSQNTLLRSLALENCNISTINLTNNTALRTLFLNDNPILELDLTLNILIDELQFANTSIRGINLSENTVLEDIKMQGNDFLEEINLKNGSNGIIDITGSFPSNFTNLPLLERVCIDNVNSELAAFILDQVAHPVSFIEDCSLLKTEENDMVDLLIYPNPTQDIITMNTQHTIASVQLYSISGVIITTKPLNNYKIDMRSFASGIYLLQVNFNNGDLITKKIIKY